jgi:hypothetical protein
MEDSTILGEHMTEETFLKALGLTRRIELMAWNSGIPPLILLSGGECTEHPDIVRFIEIVVGQGLTPLLITNGMWLENKELREAILRSEWPQLFVQVTNDPRYYPTAPPRWEDPRITYIESLTAMLPLGRITRKKGEPLIPTKKAPSSFNLRSLTRSFRSFEHAVCHLRVRAMTGSSGHCTPTISDNGDVLVGESRLCFKVGTVDSTNDELTAATLARGECNRCGLEAGLPQEHKRAIGLSTLYAGTER